MTTDAALYRLLSWLSPSYPTGAFSYSHGLEWAVETRQVHDIEGLFEFVEAALEGGGGWIDAVLFAQVWRTALGVSTDAGALYELHCLSELAAAFRSSAETALESHQQGMAFLQITRRAWPHPVLDAFGERHAGEPISHCTVVALACAAHDIALEPSLHAYLHSFAANLVSAGARLIPLGQTDAQIAIARLSGPIRRLTQKAMRTALEDLGSATPGLELCSMLHETQYTRLFRS
ncbi:MAG TPA: urease accessory protein UreF [Steroidobacteraceae bacterium]|jgi:urease accessory protein